MSIQNETNQYISLNTKKESYLKS